ncbi:HAD-IIB family hydrolase [Georgenia satyanarayanai]|uniref:HAD-IIB family hydrolase n=1 Tax=Georgenia satyanarayanai TaxID=860221 RepID=UPI00203CC882|nr:HAD-IIB family hydrolase [Georgenia satyanarayanai]MCM3661575.1 HAD-IIB family hydrolase [Georgenia satyanarayanai]
MPAARLVAFDLDDTLTPSKSPIHPEMADALTALLAVVPVCIISGGQLEQFTTQVTERLELDDAARSRLHLMPTCGTRYYRYDDGGDLQEIYAHDLAAAERAEALAVLQREARRLGLWEEQTWGPALEDRGSQITFSALGQQAPLDAKRAWDPTGEKKEQLRAAVAPLLPELEVRSGGSTSIDITRQGVDKAYGMTRLAEHTGIDLADMLFIGDRLDEGGNDYPVKAMGVPCIAVEGWEETARTVRTLVAEVAAAAR